MIRYLAKRGDVTWGVYDYPVTRSQKETLDALCHMLGGLPRVTARTAVGSAALPKGAFYSQHPETGEVMIGLHHRSVSVHRTGRMTPNN